MKPEEQWTPIDYWNDLQKGDLEAETYIRVGNELAEYAEQLEARATSLDSLALSEKVRGDELEAYCDKLAAGLPDGMLPKDVEVLRKANHGLAEEAATLKRGIRDALNNLGIPQDGYPAPVAEACNILDALLTAEEVDDE